MKKNICLNSDYHCHTAYSDGKDSVEDMICAAIDIGLKTIAITEHVNMDTLWLEEYLSEIKELRNKFKGKLNILSGFESKVVNLKGVLDVKQEWFDLVDVTLGSIHSIPSENGFFSVDSPGDKEEIRRCWKESFKGLFRNPHVNIIAHPFAELKDFGIMVDSGMKESLLRHARENSKIIEFNLKHFTLDNGLFMKILDSGTRVSIGSDAHSAEELYLLHKKKLEYFTYENTFCPNKV